MMLKRSIVLVMAVLFTLGSVGLCFAAGDIKGTVSKIEGDQITILDAAGNEAKIKVEDQATLKDLKIGDKVSVKDGKVTKEKS
jgi:Cu/Ag efflux protein CusF